MDHRASKLPFLSLPGMIGRAGLLVVLLGCFCGCQVLRKGGADDTADAIDAGAPFVVVEMHDEGRAPQQHRVVLRDAMTVQGALEEADVLNELGQRDIQVIRFVGTQGRPVKMGVTYVKQRRAIAAHTDYALMPNDRIVLTKKNTYPLEGLVGSVARILGTTD